MKILLVEDDESLVAILMQHFRPYHYIVDAVKDGETGWNYGSTFEYDLIILDIMLPQLNGIRLCQRLRSAGYTTPILLLTAQDTSTAKIEGLEAGADDYVVKPFDGAELMARIRALVRRSSAHPLSVMSWGDLVLNPSTCEVTYNGQPLILTTKEYDLLELLLRERAHVFSSDEILDRLWASEEFPAEATVRSHIRRLRNKLQAAGAPHDLIGTMHGRGYYLKSPTQDTPASFTPIAPQPSLPDDRTPTRDLQAEEQQRQYLAFLNDTWRTAQPKCLSQIQQLLDILHSAPNQPLNEPAHHHAHHLAHQLAGTVSLFGLTAAMQLARQVEQILRTASTHADIPIRAIAALLTDLQHTIQTTHTLHLIPDGTTPPPMPPESPVNLLIVDDDSDWLSAVPTLLQPWNFNITTLADPHQFWAVLQTVRPDALVLDVNMPPFNGFDLCQVLRSHPHWQRLPILFLSSWSDPTTQNQAFAIGADDYLCKPIQGSDLATRILNRLQRLRSWAT